MSKIIDIYQLKLKELNKHNDLYFNKSRPIISDSEYDKLKIEILNLEKKHSFLKKTNSSKNIVGAKPSKNFIKLKHRVKMLSLSNAFDKDDLQNFEKKILNYLNITNKKINISYIV